MTQKELDRMLDELVKDRSPEEILGETGLVKELTKRLVERVLEGEMTAHLGYERHAPSGKNSGNSKNGEDTKTALSDTGSLEISIPRDRKGSFEPQLVAKRQRRLPGFDGKVIALYARGMTTREIQGHLAAPSRAAYNPSFPQLGFQLSSLGRTRNKNCKTN